MRFSCLTSSISLHSFSTSSHPLYLDTANVAEEKAMKEKGLFFHPSPASTPCNEKPHLLPLFPTTTAAIVSLGFGSSSST
ncbi:VQ motif-containing protein 4 [Glycine soja]|nr:VQ motif-containing protein 4 [Glycine max]